MFTHTPGRAKSTFLITAWILAAIIALIGSGLDRNRPRSGRQQRLNTVHHPGQPTARPARHHLAGPRIRADRLPGQCGPTPNLELAVVEGSPTNHKGPTNIHSPTSPRLTLSNLTPGDSYKVKIRSRYYNADRTVRESSGPWTHVMTQRVKDHPPATPTSITTSSIEHDSLTLGWNDPQDGNITGYRVLRGAEANSLLTIEDNTGSTSTNYTDATVEPETTYHYAVVALSANGDSPQSSSMSATTPAAPKSKDPPPERVGPRQSITATEVPATWSLKPTDVAAGSTSSG